MATKAFQKIYTKITQITKATCSLKATEVGYDELATVDGKLAQVVKIAGDDVTLQVFEGTEGIPTTVSYTHLDVYKRQPCNFGIKGPNESWAQRIGPGNCLTKTQGCAKLKDYVYSLTPARCWKVKRRCHRKRSIELKPQ